MTHNQDTHGNVCRFILEVDSVKLPLSCRLDAAALIREHACAQSVHRRGFLIEFGSVTVGDVELPLFRTSVI